MRAMRGCRLVVWWALTCVLTLCQHRSSAADEVVIPADLFPSYVEEVCKDFSGDIRLKSGWHHSDCINVWMSYIRTLPRFLFNILKERDMIQETAAELRRRGTPCLVQPPMFGDGVGSSTMRYLMTWMFAEEMGCDWMTPVWRKRQLNPDGTILYCHRTTNIAEWHAIQRGEIAYDKTTMRCAVHNWVKFFNFEAHTVSRPTNSSFRTIEAQPDNPIQLQNALDELETLGYDGRSWDRLEIVIAGGVPTHYAQNLRSWDDYKRQQVRSILNRFRRSFYEFPRPWYDTRPECSYGTSQLDFAIHIRLGDRTKLIMEDFNSYIVMLESFMDTVTQRVLNRGLDKPVFHVFSETAIPCPPMESATFDEFPTWPVESDQIQSCMDAETPEDCPERKWDQACSPSRPGVFRVQGRPLYLHIGLDVQNAMSCMAKADGILMGCSTFGHIAGVLNKGISFFSVQCEGDMSPVHYKMVPQFAIAEQGRMWVPVSGTWRNPALNSTEIFEVALDELLKNKGISS